MKLSLRSYLGKIDIRLLSVLILGLFLLTNNIHKPFIGHHDWNGVQYSTIGRNYLRYGLVATKLAQLENGGIVDRSEFAVNTHYPPTFPLLLSGSFKIFGISEWSARLVSLLFSLCTVIGVYKLSEGLIGRNTGWIAALLLIVTPMFRYFAKMPVHEPIITTFIVWAVYGYAKFRDTNQKKYWQLTAFFIIGAQTIGWPGYYLLPWLFLYDWITNKKPDIKKFTPLFLGAALIFSLFLFHNQITTGSPFGGGLGEILKFRLNILNREQHQFYGFTPRQFLKQEALWTTVFFTRVQVLLTSMYLVLWVLKKEAKQNHSGLVLLLLLYGFTHMSIFRNAAYIHDYLIFYLAPGIALAATGAIREISNQVRKLLPTTARIIPQAIPALLVIASFWERHRFYEALENSSMHEIGKLVGEELKTITKPTDTIASPTGEFALIFSRFATFYADRSIYYYSESGKESINADYLMIVKSKEPPGFDPAGFENGKFFYWKKL